jgi:hypothetical protein
MKYTGMSSLVVVAVLGAGIAPVAIAQTLFINEVMAANSSTVTDPDYNDYADWFELYNAGNTEVNLNGYSVTDLLSQPQKYRFTAKIIVPAHSFVIIWADDRNVNNHANFKLSASGESVGLFDPAGNVVDSMSFTAQQDNVSYGRCPDGTSQWFRLSPASPGTPNMASQIFNKLPPPNLSHASGFYPGPITLTLTHSTSGASLRYTTDGHTPTAASKLYTSPVQIDSTTAVRVAAFKDGMLPSATTTSTFFIQDPTTLPAFSLVTDPENFFSDTTGIYVAGTNGIVANCSTGPRNWNQDWERPVQLEMFEADRERAFSVSAGVKIYGGCARLYPEKSLAFYFRNLYGFDKLNYPLFPDLDIAAFNNFVLRSSGQDWWRTMFRDGMVQTLIKQGMHIDVQDYRPSILFINGQYWGIHNIREKLNEHYVAEHYGVNADSIDLVEISKGVEANNGDLTAYTRMMDFLNSHSLAGQANFDSIASTVDINDYIDYTIAEIYAANGDWPGANMKLWRERTPAAKWRWMVYDLDFTFGGNAEGQYSTNTLAQAIATNGPSWPNPPWSTLMLRRLLENPSFKNEFIQRFAVHLNTTFNTNHIITVIDSLAQGIAAEIPRHKLRWPQSLSIGTTWTGNVQIMKDFAALRPAAAISHFTGAFSLSGTYRLVIRRSHPEHGKVFTHSVEIPAFDSTCVFFCNIPLRVNAVPEPGYRFVQWQGAINSTNPETTIVRSSNAVLTAVFEPASLSVDDMNVGDRTYSLFANYPNPFNPSTKIGYRVSDPGTRKAGSGGSGLGSSKTGPGDWGLGSRVVRLTVYDILGREVAVLVNENRAPGSYEVTWDASHFSSGVYIYRMTSGEFVESRRMLFIR